MKYLSLETGTEQMMVSKIALGSAMKLDRITKKDFFDIFDAYVGMGGNCIDTARAYNRGQSEEILGEYLRSRGNRQKFLICTKGCNLGADGSARLGKEELMADFEASLKALGTDYIDIYWIHKDDLEEHYPVDEVINGLNQLKRDGKIRAFGCSNWHTWRIAEAKEYAMRQGQFPFMASQIQWSLANTLEEYFKKFTSIVMDRKSYDWYRQQNMPVFAFSPQAKGFFSKVEANGFPSLQEEMKMAYGSPENMERLERVRQYAAEHNCALSAVVLAFLINNKLPCVPVIGAYDVRTLQESMSAVDLQMSSLDADRLFFGSFKD